jgi:hypothetical protein
MTAFRPDSSIMDEIVLGSTRGGGKPRAALQTALVRELTESDLGVLVEGPGPSPDGAAVVRAIRSSHHKLAQALAMGHSEQEASLLTGYSSSWISQMKGDPAFKSLMAYYRENQELVFVDVLERMKGVGVSALEELQERLETKPEEFSPRTLLEVMDLTLVKAGGLGTSPGVQGGGNAPLSVQINFVQPPAQRTALAAPTIDGDAA